MSRFINPRQPSVVQAPQTSHHHRQTAVYATSGITSMNPRAGGAAIIATSALTAAAAIAPELAGATSGDSLLAKIERLSPKRRRELVTKLAAAVGTLLLTADQLSKPKPVPLCGTLILLALALYDLVLAVQSIDSGD